MKIQCSVRQANFIKEIYKNNYSEDEAIAEITNNKYKYNYYNDYMQIINVYFGQCENKLEREELYNLLK